MHIKQQFGKERNALSPKKHISSNQHFSNFFSKNVNFTKFLPKMCELNSINSAVIAHCGNLLSHILDKNLVKATLALRNYEMISRNIFLVRECLVFPHSQCGNYRNLLSLFSDKNFVKLTFLLKS